MKVTKKMIHEDLRKASVPLRILPHVLSHKWSTKYFNALITKEFKGKDILGLQCDETYIPSSDGVYQIRTRIYKPINHTGKLPIMLYIHGGGYIVGNPEQFNTNIEGFIKKRPCIIVSPDYRLALEKPYPAAFDDCYDTLLWAKENASVLGATTDKLMVAGHSAGGGLTAAVTLKARDTKDVDIAFQMPIYPMIDDTQPTDPSRKMFTPAWDNRSNTFGWAAYHADLIKNNHPIPAYAAPARNKDYTDFPPTITFVGDLEPFYQETIEYVDRLREAGIHVAFKEYKRCFHGFDLLGENAQISKDGIDFTYDTYAEFYDKYL